MLFEHCPAPFHEVKLRQNCYEEEFRRSASTYWDLSLFLSYFSGIKALKAKFPVWMAKGMPSFATVDAACRDRLLFQRAIFQLFSDR